ncbi:peptidase A24A prepilin type IV [Ammonifex degensii KC4]|uniref:Peptidase A24A prepilin type IV n=1 Tax=Ammonifex degensii (strain DSM 10501 / KC4) TaxID=429009 RepID=C9RCD2_AMMDK|nr:prepilin peptidase [Ammonifex degensii]ACX51909.1 peptidase A24A prepilin type IV [Ammonifex degensii KC4]
MDGGLRELLCFGVGCFLPAAVGAYADLKSGVIPDKATLPVILAGLVYGLCTGHLWWGLVGFLAALALFGGAALAGGVGGGDLKLALGLGLWLGPFGFLWAVAVAGLSAFLYGAARKARKKELRLWAWRFATGAPVAGSEAVPFGPFLCLGALASFLLSPGTLHS